MFVICLCLVSCVLLFTFMKVLAIDPGYERCGVAVLEKLDGQERLLESACLQTAASLPFAERLAHIGAGVKALMEAHAPDALAIETLYFNTNQKTAMAVAEVRGAIIYLASSRGMAVHEYTPPQIKVAITSSGRADKKQVMALVPKLIAIEKEIQFDDEYDAIAVGLTHLACVRVSR